jgi:hypothetical protein
MKMANFRFLYLCALLLDSPHSFTRCAPSFVRSLRDINKVDAVMDDIREQMDLANEISDAISQPVGFGVEFDEEELNAELEELEQESLEEKLLDTGREEVRLPSVPSTVPGGCPASSLSSLVVFLTTSLRSSFSNRTTATTRQSIGPGSRRGRRAGGTPSLHGDVISFLLLVGVHTLCFVEHGMQI